MLFVKSMFFKILNFKFQNSKNGMHQFGPNYNFIQKFSSLALKWKAVGVAQIYAYAGSGGTGHRDFFLALIMVRYKMV
jgi:hypothetical protein